MNHIISTEPTKYSKSLAITMICAIVICICYFCIDLLKHQGLKKALIFTGILAFSIKTYKILCVIVNGMNKVIEVDESEQVLSTIFEKAEVVLSSDWLLLFSTCTAILIGIQLCLGFHLIKNSFSYQDHYHIFILFFTASLVLGALSAYKLYQFYRNDVTVTPLPLLIIIFADIISLINSYFMSIELINKPEKQLLRAISCATSESYELCQFTAPIPLAASVIVETVNVLVDSSSINISEADSEMMAEIKVVDALIEETTAKIQAAIDSVDTEVRVKVLKIYKYFEKFMKLVKFKNIYLSYKTRTTKSPDHKIDLEVDFLKGLKAESDNLYAEFELKKVNFRDFGYDPEDILAFKNRNSAINEKLDGKFSGQNKDNPHFVEYPSFLGLIYTLLEISMEFDVDEKTKDEWRRTMREDYTLLRYPVNDLKTNSEAAMSEIYSDFKSFESIKAELASAIETFSVLHEQIYEVFSKEKFQERTDIEILKRQEDYAFSYVMYDVSVLTKLIEDSRNIDSEVLNYVKKYFSSNLDLVAQVSDAAKILQLSRTSILEIIAKVNDFNRNERNAPKVTKAYINSFFTSLFGKGNPISVSDETAAQDFKTYMEFKGTNDMLHIYLETLQILKSDIKSKDLFGTIKSSIEAVLKVLTKITKFHQYAEKNIRFNRAIAGGLQSYFIDPEIYILKEKNKDLVYRITKATKGFEIVRNEVFDKADVISKIPSNQKILLKTDFIVLKELLYRIETIVPADPELVTQSNKL